MKIFAKSALLKEQIDTKMDIGLDGIELQIRDELIEMNTDKILGFDDILEIEKIAKYPIEAIHAPISNYVPKYCADLEYLLDSNQVHSFNEILYLADKIGKYKEKEIIIIVHTSLQANDKFFDSDIWDMISERLKYFLNMYSNIKIAIENVTPFEMIKNGSFTLRNGYDFSNVKIALKLREILHTNRIGTVLDICHAQITNKHISSIYKLLNKEQLIDYSIDSFMKENKDTIFLIHLSDFKENGYGKGNHGISFNDITGPNKIKNFLEIYEKYNYSCPVTLEVSEADYLICDGYKKSRKILLTELNKRT